MDQHIVIVGGGLAGVRAAEGAREAGHEGPITIVAAEDVTPYERPPLSKDLLVGDADLEDAVIHGAGWFEEHDIELRIDTRVALIDAERQLAIVDESDQIPYGELILATGASPKRLDIEGDHLSLVGALRTVDDARIIRSLFEQQKKVVIVGSGWIGTEVAAAASGHGCDVTVVSRSEVPMQRLLGRQFGEYLRELHESHGVAFVTGTTPAAYAGDDQVRQVRLSNGQVLDADMVIEAIGARPRVGLAETAGVDVDDGVLVDESLRTSRAHIWAVGDIANQMHPFYGTRIRSEHWSVARNQGYHAGRGAAGEVAPYDRLPMLFTDQYDMGMEYRGNAPDFDDVIFRGSAESGEFLVFYLERGVIRAVANVNTWGIGDEVDALLRAEVSPDRRGIADWETPLAELY
jgi:3-phenylpropionate/trans-cinnamate dioxygenase ferredoxin reductase subunit